MSRTCFIVILPELYFFYSNRKRNASVDGITTCLFFLLPCLLVSDLLTNNEYKVVTDSFDSEKNPVK